ncbi:MAG: hypothetical protein ACX932_03610 [Gammaproteobacteria bacterium]
MNIKESLILTNTLSQIETYLQNATHFHFDAEEEKQFLDALDVFNGRNKGIQRILTAYYGIRHFFDHSFWSVMQRKDIAFLLQYKNLLNKVIGICQDADQDESDLNRCLLQGLKTLFMHTKYGTLNSDDKKVYVKNSRLKNIIIYYDDASCPANSLLGKMVKFIKRSYYRIRYPIDRCLPLKNSCNFVDRMCSQDNVEINEQWLHDFFLSYTTMCQFLLPSYKYSHEFFDHCDLANKKNIVLNNKPSEKQPLLENSDNRSHQSSFSIILSPICKKEATNLTSMNNNVTEDSEEKAITMIFKEELGVLRQSVLEMEDYRNKEGQLLAIQQIKRLLLKYHPDKHMNEDEVLLSVYLDCIHCLNEYYDKVLKYFETGDKKLLQEQDNLSSSCPVDDELNLYTHVNNFLNRVNEYAESIQVLKKEFAQRKKEQEEIAQAHIEIDNKQTKLLQAYKKLRADQDKIAQAQAKTRADQDKIAQAQAKARAAQNKIAQAQAKARAVQDKIAQGQTKIQADHIKRAQLQATVRNDQTKVAQGQTKIQADQAKIAQSQAKLRDNQTKVAQVHKEIKADQTKVAQVHTEIGADQAKIAQVHGEIADHQTKISQGQTELRDNQTKMSEEHEKITFMSDNIEKLHRVVAEKMRAAKAKGGANQDQPIKKPISQQL